MMIEFSPKWLTLFGRMRISFARKSLSRSA